MQTKTQTLAYRDSCSARISISYDFSDLLGCQTHYLLNGWLCTPIVQVSTGSDAEMPQDVMAINTAEKQCCVLGELSEQANITTDLDQMLGSVIDLG